MDVRFFVSFQFGCMVDYTDGHLYIELPLHPWDEAHLIWINDVFDVVLDLGCKKLIEYFSLYFHEGD